MPAALAVIAAAALTCVGSGVVEHAGPPKTESRSGNRWLDDYNNAHDGFTATIRIDDSDQFRMTMPRQIIDFPAYIPMVRVSDDGRRVTAARSMGMRRVVATLDRETGSITISAPEGAFTGICRRE